ncbi:MAG TPA: hypothetical protein QGF86_01625 [Nitrospinaceae bacterium]|nr:hypothetical protein [Nitrospinaceae bacterium]
MTRPGCEATTPAETTGSMDWARAVAITFHRVNWAVSGLWSIPVAKRTAIPPKVPTRA